MESEASPSIPPWSIDLIFLLSPWFLLLNWQKVAEGNWSPCSFCLPGLSFDYLCLRFSIWGQIFVALHFVSRNVLALKSDSALGCAALIFVDSPEPFPEQVKLLCVELFTLFLFAAVRFLEPVSHLLPPPHHCSFNTWAESSYHPQGRPDFRGKNLSFGSAALFCPLAAKWCWEII